MFVCVRLWSKQSRPLALLFAHFLGFDHGFPWLSASRHATGCLWDSGGGDGPWVADGPEGPWVWDGRDGPLWGCGCGGEASLAVSHREHCDMPPVKNLLVGGGPPTALCVCRVCVCEVLRRLPVPSINAHVSNVRCPAYLFAKPFSRLTHTCDFHYFPMYFSSWLSYKSYKLC